MDPLNSFDSVNFVPVYNESEFIPGTGEKKSQVGSIGRENMIGRGQRFGQERKSPKGSQGLWRAGTDLENVKKMYLRTF